VNPFEQWKAERNRVLRELDMEAARDMLPFASGDDVRLAAMHKARYDCKDIEPELRHASRAWLHERGMGDMHGASLLPEGELPA
jgi:hypothetical protein